MACVSLGPHEVTLAQDEGGHRTYTVVYKVEGTPGVDGVYAALNAIGLPQAGQLWGNVDADGDIDPCAWCRPTADVKRSPDQKEGEKAHIFWVTKVFSTKPQEQNKERCELGACSPLDEPQGVTIDYSNFTEEASYDRFGRRITSSSHEPIHGSVNEWEWTRTAIKINQKVADPQLELIEQLKDSVNVFTLWGFPPRTLKFKPGGNVRHIRISSPETLMGTEIVGTCESYWERTLIFESRYRRREGVMANIGASGTAGGTDTFPELAPAGLGHIETWDRDVWDEGTKVLRGRWTNEAGIASGTVTPSHWQLTDINGSPPDPSNPSHFIKFKDWNGENQKTLLDGAGKPALVNYIEYKWWIFRETPATQYLGDGGFTTEVTVNVDTPARLPCNSALAHVNKQRDTTGVSSTSTYTLHGPFVDQSALQDAILTGAVGPAVTDCPTDFASVGVIRIEKYAQSDFRLLGIPDNLTTPTPPFTI